MRYPPLLLIALFLARLLRPFASPSAAPVGFFLVLVFLTVIYAFRHIRNLTIALAVLGGIAVITRFAGDDWQLLDFLVISRIEPGRDAARDG